MKKYILFFIVIIFLIGCNMTSQPKPRGYFRITLPQSEYVSIKDSQYLNISKHLPYTFDVNNMAKLTNHTDTEQYWIDINYPQYSVKVHCSYKSINNNLRELSDDAQRFVYNHAGKASAIPEQGYENPDKKVYGVLYQLIGNTASPCQLYLTDSIHHFFRAAVYFNCIPNQDSLAPIINYIENDMRHLVETLEWR